MQAGRKAAKARAQEGLIDTEVKVKKVKVEVHIIGYGMDKGENERPYPIFASEERNTEAGFLLLLKRQRS
jgi:hypothetical protein